MPTLTPHVKFPSRPSLVRTFAILACVVIAITTVAQVALQWSLLRRDLLAWERGATAREVRASATLLLRAEDFRDWRRPEAQARFAEFFRHALFTPELLRVKVYGPDMRVIWSDEPRLLGQRFADNEGLVRALAGETVVHLERADKRENVFERHFATTIELYVPITLPGATTPGAASVAGVVEIYKDPSPLFANLIADQLAIIGASVGGALVLYSALLWLVRRAAHDLDRQRGDLERHADVLGRTMRALEAAQQQVKLSARLAALGEASMAVAHGIRNPLANIRASAQLALDRTTTREPVERQLTVITEEVDRLGVWLRSLLDSARPFEPRCAPTDLNALIEDSLRILGPRLAAGDVRVEPRFAPDLPALAADEAQLQQALVSVLENAVDASPPGGRLAVETVAAEDTVTVTVCDEGAGIPAERLGHVFEPFYTTKTRGTGLGLAIARRVVEAHGGRITIDSAPGAGVTVRLLLPAGVAG